MRAVVDPEFWCNKKVFVTGHTGFKGSWLALWLQSLGAQVKGFALPPPTTPALFNEAGVDQGMQSEFGDIRDPQAVAASMKAFGPDILIHMAAQPLVRLSYQHPIETYATNVMGSVHVLEAARHCPNLRAIINVTTDKCYENREWEWGYRENEAMGGHDPYSSSKGCAELVTAAYRKSFFHEPGSAAVATARAGNVIGGGDWAQDRLIPDIIHAFEAGKPAVIRYPQSIRPWQHVLESLSGYLLLAQRLWKDGELYAGAWNFGPGYEDVRCVEWIVNRMAKLWGDAGWVLEGEAQPYEAKYLKLDTSRARDRLEWHPLWGLEASLERIVGWHKSRCDGATASTLCLEQIDSYMKYMTATQS